MTPQLASLVKNTWLCPWVALLLMLPVWAEMSLEEKIRKIRSQKESAKSIQRKTAAMKSSVQNLKWLLENSGIEAEQSRILVEKVHRELETTTQDSVEQLVQNLSAAEASGSNVALEGAIKQQRSIIDRFKKIKATVGVKAKRAEVERELDEILSRTEASLEDTKLAFEQSINGQEDQIQLDPLKEEQYRTADRLEVLQENMPLLRQLIGSEGDMDLAAQARLAADHSAERRFDQAMAVQKQLWKRLGGVLKDLQKEDGRETPAADEEKPKDLAEDMEALAESLEEQLNQLDELKELQEAGEDIEDNELHNETLDELEELKEQLEDVFEENEDQEAIEEAIEAIEEALEDMLEQNIEDAVEATQEAIDALAEEASEDEPFSEASQDDEAAESGQESEQSSSESSESESEQSSSESSESEGEENGQEETESSSSSSSEEQQASAEESDEVLQFSSSDEESEQKTGGGEVDEDFKPVGGDGPPPPGGGPAMSNQPSEGGQPNSGEGEGSSDSGSGNGQKESSSQNSKGSASESKGGMQPSSGESSGQSEGNGSGVGSGAGEAKEGAMNEKSNTLSLGKKVSAFEAWERKASPQAQRQINSAMKATSPRGYEDQTDAYFKALVNAQKGK
jgi:hypothetical protein